MSDRYITGVVHGESKAGKTWLAATAPKPLLVLDAEAGGMRFVPGKRIRWNPATERPPAADGAWDICQVSVNSTQQLDLAFQWLNSGQHHFRSVVIDSIMEIQSRLKRELSSTGIMEQQDWGRALVFIEDVAVKFRDLCEHPTAPLSCVVYTAGTRFRDGKFRPLLQGQIVNVLPYKVDFVGFLQVVTDQEGNHRRGLIVEDDGIHVAGNRFGGRLPAVVWDPSLEQMFTQVFGQTADDEQRSNA